ncbi:MAG: NADPH-dependent F420 reductase [Jatrophihabitantaceae bacterium]
MRIGVVGTGNIGGTLGTALARAGHQVKLGSRQPRPAADGPEVTDLAGAIADAEVVLLALPAGALDDFLAEHAGSIDGKLVIDATNRIGAPVANAAAQIAGAAPNARYARAFNTLGWENFAEPDFDGVPADMFFSAPRQDRATVEELITAVGLRPVYLGEGKQDVVDGVLPLWFALVQANGGNRRVALRVLRK